MKRQEIEATVAAAYPVDRERIERLDIESLEADLLADVDDLGEADSLLPGAAATPPDRPRGWRSGSRRLGLGFAVAALAAAVVAVVLLGGGGDERPSSVYGAELVRFAESTPLLLLEGPGWSVRSVEQSEARGRIEFATASPEPHPDESLETRAEVKRHVTAPAVVARRQRLVELAWYDSRDYSATVRHGKVSLSFYDTDLHKRIHLHVPGHSLKIEVKGLGVTAYVNPHSETSWRQGGPGDRAMLAYWYEGAHLIEMRASVPDLAAFRERLEWLRRVGPEDWLDAMPARVVKAADYAATVESMLTGIPLPPGFDPSRLKTEGITTDRYQVGAAVGGAVACDWFRTWDEAVEGGDGATVKKAEAVLMKSESWPIFREMAKEGAYPATVIEYAEKMPSRKWYGRPLLSAVEEGLGCGMD
jgi:hypothetical protein